MYTPPVPGKRLSALLTNINILSRNGGADPEITGLAYDSRDVKPGCIFFALPGVHTDGHRFISQALERGAAAVVHAVPFAELMPASIPKGKVFLRVDNTRHILSPISAAFYGHPSRSLRIIGVTGTDGKSTTVSFIHQILEALGKKCGFLSTVQYKALEKVEENPYRQSTPEAPEIHALLALMRDSGKEFAVLEATSHGLSARNSRLADICFSGAVVTNVTHEHLEFHGSYAQYLDDKANLFRFKNLPPGNTPFAVINNDDSSAEYLKGVCPAPVITYGLKPGADLRGNNLRLSASESHFSVQFKGKNFPACLKIPGAYNIENALAALAAVSETIQVSPESLIPILPLLNPIKGRMVPIRAGQPYNVLVDYAHTPGAFTRVLPFVKEQTKGRLIILFGSAGERDVEKRSLQGKAAGGFGDILVLADEDPRGEAPAKILSDIALGCPEKTEGKDLFLIPDRREAIRKALSLACEKDTVIFLGKGHESSIIYKENKIIWDEEGEVRNALAEQGYASAGPGSSEG